MLDTMRSLPCPQNRLAKGRPAIIRCAQYTDWRIPKVQAQVLASMATARLTIGRVGCIAVTVDRLDRLSTLRRR
jgi:hypothetical protein